MQQGCRLCTDADWHKQLPALSICLALQVRIGWFNRAHTAACSTLCMISAGMFARRVDEQDDIKEFNQSSTHTFGFRVSKRVMLWPGSDQVHE